MPTVIAGQRLYNKNKMAVLVAGAREKCVYLETNY